MKKWILLLLTFAALWIVIIQACKDEELPEVTSINKIELTLTEDSTSYVFAQLKCDLNQNPKFEIEQYGFCWDTIANVTIEKENNSFENLTDQSFNATIESLLPQKTYYVKGYIQNGDVIIYSNELTIQTLDARPVVTTIDITNILANSAQAGGVVEAYETLFPITQRGVCWAKIQNPTIADSLTNNGTGNGTFTSQLQNLDIGVNYYIRAYAVNSEGITYGNEISFSTLDGVPELTTDSIKNITATNATLYGNIIENDGLEILEKGFCWNTSTNPSIANNSQIVTGNTLGNFNAEITGLVVNTTFYVKAYIKNESGTFYGDEIIFSTNDGLSSVVTNSVSNITAISASCSGSINDNGGFAITARGMCWSKNENPSITDSHTTDGTGSGDFTSTLTGLDANTTYYVRAYATNINGTTYGNQLNFTTEDGLPTIITTAISNITATSAQSGGNITDDGGAPITERGICWSTSQNPTLSSNYISNGSGTGNFTAALTSLNANSTYYVRAYAKNAAGTTYGNELNFTTDDGIPTLTTTSISNIQAITATSGGNITDDGGLAISARGVCWGTSSNPTINDSKTSNGTGTGSFTSNLSGLDVNTTYYVRAYATNSAGTTYGNEQSFTTKTGLPTITTNDVTAITYNAATSGGNITDNGGFTITDRGVCWSTSSNPTTSGNITSDGTGTGSFISSITGLTANTTYYVRAYATNSTGTSYGSELSFTTSDFITDYDGNAYGMVTIGSQVWLTSNLNVTHYRNGDAIPLFTDGTTWSNLQDGSYSNYDNIPTNANTYGRLYNYYTTVDSRGLCPTGWRVPTDQDWDNLVIYLGGDAVAGGKMKEIGTEHWTSNTGATNESGFTALPGGQISNEGTFAGINYTGQWWTSSEYYNNAYALNRQISYSGSVIFKYDADKNRGASVRCIQGEGTYLPDVTTTSVTAIKSYSALIGGNVVTDGGDAVTARGVCWSTSENPVVGGNQTSDGSGAGSYTSEITGLSANTTYYVRAYATNSVGTNYGDQISFITPQTATDYDGNLYESVIIGNQVWMSENLKSTHYADGSAMVDGTGAGNIDADYTTKYYFNYNDNVSYVAAYGRLYTWAAVMNGEASSNTNPSGVQGACPDGWHIPSDAEWTELTDYLGGETVAGGKLKEIDLTHWNSPNTGATNETGFTAVGSGYRDDIILFQELNNNTFWWTTTQYNIDPTASVWGRILYYNSAEIVRNVIMKDSGFSVRCIKD